MCMAIPLNSGRHSKTRILQNILESILGSSGRIALEYHLSRILGEEPLQVFIENPRRFYEALREIFGENGARVTFRLLCGKLAELSKAVYPTPEDLFELMLKDEKAARREIRRLIGEAMGRG